MTQQTYQTTWWRKIGETSGEETHSGCIRYSIYENIETREVKRSDQLPIGALYAIERDADILFDQFPPCGYDGLSIACVLIGNGGPDSRHHWYIDYKASNCTMPDDDKHRCWVRHGTVGEKLTVNKEPIQGPNGLITSCQAGAGSFFMDNQSWHGFLTNGELKP